MRFFKPLKILLLLAFLPCVLKAEVASSTKELIGSSKNLLSNLDTKSFRLPKKELARLATDAEFFFVQKDYVQSIVRIKMMRGEYKKAKKKLDSKYYYYLSKSYYELGFIDLCVKSLKKMAGKPIPKRYWGDIIAMSSEIFSSGKARFESSFFDKLLASYSDDTTKGDSSFYLAKSFFIIGDNMKAYKFLKNVKPTDSVYPRAIVLKGLVYMNNGQTEPASDIFTFSLNYLQNYRGEALKPSQKKKLIDHCYLNLGRINFELSQYDKAFDFYNRIGLGSPLFSIASEEKVISMIEQVKELEKPDLKRIKVIRQNLEILQATIPSVKMKYLVDLIYAENLIRLGLHEESKELFNNVIEVFEGELNRLKEIKKSRKNRVKFFESLLPRKNLGKSEIDSQSLNLSLDSAYVSKLVGEVAEDIDIVRYIVFWARELKIISSDIASMEQTLSLFSEDQIKENVEMIPYFRERIEKAYQLKAAYNLKLLENSRQIKELFKGTKVENGRELQLLFKESSQSAKNLSALPLSSSSLKSRKDTLSDMISKLEDVLLKRKLEYKALVAKTNIINSEIQKRKIKSSDARSLKRFKETVNLENDLISQYGKQISRIEKKIQMIKQKVGEGTGIHENELKALDRIQKALKAEEAILMIYRKFLTKRGKKSLDKLFAERKRLKRVELNLEKFNDFIQAWARSNFEPHLKTFKSEKKTVAKLKRTYKKLKKKLGKLIRSKKVDAFDYLYRGVESYVIRAKAGLIENMWFQKTTLANRLDEERTEHNTALRDLTKRFYELGGVEE